MTEKNKIIELRECIPSVWKRMKNEVLLSSPLHSRPFASFDDPLFPFPLWNSVQLRGFLPLRPRVRAPCGLLCITYAWDSLLLIKGLIARQIMPIKVRTAKVTTITKKGCSIIISPHIVLLLKYQLLLQLMKKLPPQIKRVFWGISHLITVPSTKLPNANFEISVKNFPKSWKTPKTLLFFSFYLYLP